LDLAEPDSAESGDSYGRRRRPVQESHGERFGEPDYYVAAAAWGRGRVLKRAPAA